jgi:hypothetical protein
MHPLEITMAGADRIRCKAAEEAGDPASRFAAPVAHVAPQGLRLIPLRCLEFPVEGVCVKGQANLPVQRYFKQHDGPIVAADT